MILFFTENIVGNFAVLEEEEARHCSQVLRKKVGETIFWIDGKGGFYEGFLREIGKKDCKLEIIKKETDFHKPNFHLHIAIAPTKNTDRIEWFLEKATEIGIQEISFPIFQRSERRELRIDRFQKILISAAKQSLKAYLPKINEPRAFKTFLSNPNLPSQKLIAKAGENKSLKDNYTLHKDVLILIGPEGDFSPEEMNLALQNGFQGINLGESRLRTETAGLVACHSIQFLNANHPRK